MRVLWWSFWANLLPLLALSSCRCESEPGKPAGPVPTKAAAAAVLDACTAEARAACKASGCDCLNGRCSGGKCPALNDGCSRDRRSACGTFACGCLNDRCSGGYCQPMHDGCSEETAKNCASYGCGCVNGRCSGGSCPVLHDGCADPIRNTCAAAGCGCFNDQCTGGACPEIADGCADKARNDCAGFGCSCWNDKCVGGSCPKDLSPPGQPESGPGSAKYPHLSFQKTESGKTNTDAVVFTPDSPPANDAPVVVLFHGLWPSARPKLYEPLARHLVRKGYNVVIPLYGSTNGVHVPDLEQYGKDARQAITAALGRLKAKPATPLAFVGHGVGALTALELGTLAPSPKALVLFDPSGDKGPSAAKGWSAAELAKLAPGIKLLILTTAPVETGFGGASAIKDIWQNAPATAKNLWVIRTDRKCSLANPTLCIDAEQSSASAENAVLVGISAGGGGFTGGEYGLNAVDWRGYWRLTEAALEVAFERGVRAFDPFCRKATDPKCDDKMARDMGEWTLGKGREPFPVPFSAEDPLVTAVLAGSLPAKPDEKPEAKPGTKPAAKPESPSKAPR